MKTSNLPIFKLSLNSYGKDDGGNMATAAAPGARREAGI